MSDERQDFVPTYAKPDEPGIAMNFDNTVSLLHVVQPGDSFEDVVEASFALLRQAQDQYPDWPRVFYVDVVGHKGDRHGFDEDLFEFQQDFWFSTIAHFVSAFELPLTGALINPNAQRNDVPDELLLRGPGE